MLYHIELTLVAQVLWEEDEAIFGVRGNFLSSLRLPWDFFGNSIRCIHELSKKWGLLSYINKPNHGVTDRFIICEDTSTIESDEWSITIGQIAEMS